MPIPAILYIQYSPSMKSPDICIVRLSQVSHVNKVKIHNQIHILGQKQEDKITLQNNPSREKGTILWGKVVHPGREKAHKEDYKTKQIWDIVGGITVLCHLLYKWPNV